MLYKDLCLYRVMMVNLQPNSIATIFCSCDHYTFLIKLNNNKGTLDNI